MPYIPGSYIPDSTTKQIKELTRRIDTLTNQLIFSTPTNDLSPIFANLGSRDAAHGALTGMEVIRPIFHNVTDVDDSGTATGTFNRINLMSSNVVVDWPGHTAIDLKYIQKTPNDGTRIGSLTVKSGKTLTLKTGGNMTNASDVTITDQDMAYLVYSQDISNKYRIITSGAATGSGANINLSNLSATAVNVSILPGTNHTIDLGDATHNWRSVFTRDVRLTIGVAAALDATLPMISGDLTNNFVINIPTGSLLRFYYGGTEKYDFSASEVHAPNLTTDNLLTINDSSLNPANPGEFRRNGADVLVYSGGAVRNLTSTTGANTALSNLASTAVNVAIIPGTTNTIDLGDTTHYFRSTYGRDFRMDSAALSLDAAIPMISGNATSDFVIGVPTGSLIRFYFNAVEKYDFSASEIHGPNLTSDGLLTLNDSALNPSSNGQFRRNGPDVLVYSGGAVRNLSSAGGGGVSFPILPPIHAFGSVGSATLSFDLSITTAHVHTMTLTGDVTFVFNNPPAAGSNIQFSIEVTQDGTGGHVITWPATVNNPPVQGVGPNQRTVYVAQTSDSGSHYDVFNTDQAATLQNIGFAKTDLSNLVATAVNQSLIANLDTTLNLGSVTLHWSNTFTQVMKWVAGREIDLKTTANDGIYYFVNTTEKHSFQVVTTEIAKIDGIGLSVMGTSTLTANGDTYLLANINLGNTSANNINFVGRVNTAVLPSTDNSFALGDQTRQYTRLHLSTAIDLYEATSTTKKLEIQKSGGDHWAYYSYIDTVNITQGHRFQVNSTDTILMAAGAITIYPDVTYINDTSSPPNGTIVETLDFVAHSSTNVVHPVARHEVIADITTSGSEFSSQHFHVMDSSTLTETLVISPSNLLLTGIGNIFEIFNTTSSAGEISDIFFSSKNSGATKKTFTKIQNMADNVTNTLEEGSQHYHVMKAGTLTEICQMTGTGILPASDNTFVLGNNALRWSKGSIVNLNDVFALRFEASTGNRQISYGGGSFLSYNVHGTETHSFQTGLNEVFNIGTDSVKLFTGINYNVTTYSGNTTIALSDNIIRCSGNSTLTLPSAATAGIGKGYLFFKTDPNTTTITIAASGIQTINGHSTVIFTPKYYVFEIISDGSNWMVVRNGIGLA